MKNKKNKLDKGAKSLYNCDMLLKGGEDVRIAICDDSEQERNTIEQYILPFRTKYSNIKIFKFCSGEELLAAYDEGEYFDFLFLDIQMKEINGIKTAQEIRKNNKHAIIFFITGFTHYVSAAFTLNAFQFLIKPVRKDSFEREFQRAIRKFYIDHNKYIVENRSRTTALEIKDILFIESSAHNIIIHAETSQYVKVGKLNVEEKKLKPFGFIRTHHGFLVNMNYIFEITQNDVIMKNGSKAMVSTRKRSDVLDSFNKFLAGRYL